MPQDMMSIHTTSIGKKELKERVFDFLYENATVWETSYDDGSYFIAIDNENEELGFTINPENKKYHSKRGSNDGWKSGAYVRNGWILGSHNPIKMKKLLDSLGMNDRNWGDTSLKDIDLTSEINDYIVDWFLLNKKNANTGKRIKNKRRPTVGYLN